MALGMTIADLVQQVLYATYKVRLDVGYSTDDDGSFHADTDKFKEVVMEANLILQDLQKDQDWNWLRERWNIGTSAKECAGHIMEFSLPDEVYKVCTGFNDAVRLHHPDDYSRFIEIPITSPRSGTVNTVAMFDQWGRVNVPDTRILAFIAGRTLTFSRPFAPWETGLLIETDVIRRMEPLHICGPECVQPCRESYECKVLGEVPDPYFVVMKTAARRAEGDPSVADRVQSLDDLAAKALSAMRENDSAKTVPDTYTTSELGYMRVF